MVQQPLHISAQIFFENFNFGRHDTRPDTWILAEKKCTSLDVGCPANRLDTSRIAKDVRYYIDYQA